MSKKVESALPYKLNKIRFLHIRLYDNYGIVEQSNEMEGNKNVISPLGGSTIAFKIIRTQTKEDKVPIYRIVFGMTFCRFDENYQKKMGRVLAEERLKSSESTTLSFKDNYVPKLDDIYFNLYENYIINRENWIADIRDMVITKD